MESLVASFQLRRVEVVCRGRRRSCLPSTGRRDLFLRRLQATSVAGRLAVATTVVGAPSGHTWQEYMACGLITVPSWAVLFNMHRLYEWNAKRLSHSTLDDPPSFFHGRSCAVF